MPNLIMICGPQAVGKMTVGQELSKLTGYKLFYNHMTIEIVRLIFDYDKDISKKMNNLIRTEIFKEFANSNEKGIIFTGCFDFGAGLQANKSGFDEWSKLFNNTYVIELEADFNERIKRNTTENRLKYKESKRDIDWSEKHFLKYEERHKCNSEGGQGEELFKNFLKINNTNISAEKVAKMIKEKFDL